MHITANINKNVYSSQFETIYQNKYLQLCTWLYET